MNGFVSGGSSFGAGVVARVSTDGSVWAQRVAAAGLQPSAPALYFPFDTFLTASAFARQLADRHDIRIFIRRGRRTTAAWEIKVLYTAGTSTADIRRCLV